MGQPIRPRFTPGRHPALWATERVGRVSPRSINEAFVTAREAAGLDEDLDLHCLRHSYITHLTEFGYPARFVQVLLSPQRCVHDVQHEPGTGGDLCGGGGYLPPSITQSSGRFDAGATGADARLAA
jgi:integrase/recombinase XerC